MFGQNPENLLERAIPHPALKPAVAGLVGRIPRREVLPGGSGAQHPQDAIQDVPWIAIRAPAYALLDRLLFREDRAYECPLLFGEIHIDVRSNSDPPVDPFPKSDRLSRT